MSTSSTSTSADALKAQGNTHYQAGRFQQAVELYSKAIEADPSNATLFSNRSVSQLQLGQHEAALADAQQCCKLKPGWEKGHFRRGAALEAMGDLRKALPAYQSALELNPMSEEIIGKVRELKKKVQPPPKATPVQAATARAAAAAAGGGRSAPNPRPSPCGWANGLTPAKQAEWLVDCYRMRVDDDYAIGGGNLRGLYAVSCDPGGNPERGLDTIAEDFLVFCKLAVQHGVVPAGWNWSAFLNTAVDMLPYAFEKEDAREKWGGENVFAAMMGGRSLRLTAELVYGEGAMAFGQGVTGGGDSGKAYKAVRRQVNKKWRQLVSSGGVVFSDVGGVAAWKKLRSKLVLPGNPMAGFEDY